MEQTFTFRAEMRDDDDSETGIGRKSAEEALESLDATSRGANTDDRERIHWTVELSF